MFSFPSSLRPIQILVVRIATCLLLAACTDKSDEGASAPDDAGIDTDERFEEAPSTESIDFDSAEAGSPAQIHIASSSRRGVVSATPPLVAEDFLSREDAEALLDSTSLTISQLAGQTSSANYNSIRYAPTNDPESFGLAIQIWKLDPALPAAERLQELRSQFLNIEDIDHDNAPDGAFSTRRAGLRTLVLPASNEAHLFALSCDTTNCTDTSELVELGLFIAAQ